MVAHEAAAQYVHQITMSMATQSQLPMIMSTWILAKVKHLNEIMAIEELTGSLMHLHVQSMNCEHTELKIEGPSWDTFKLPEYSKTHLNTCCGSTGTSAFHGWIGWSMEFEGGRKFWSTLKHGRLPTMEPGVFIGDIPGGLMNGQGHLKH